MKKVAAFLLTTVCALSLLGCNGAASSSGNANESAKSTENAVNESLAEKNQWTEQDIRSLFAKTHGSKERTILDCAIVTDGAYDRVGVVLFTDAGNDTTNVAFIDQDGHHQQCGLHAKAGVESALTYLGNGAVTFRLETEDGTAYTCKITFSAQDGNVRFVVEDNL